MLSPFAWIRQWTGSQSFLCWFFVCFVVCFVFCVVFWFVFVCLLLRFLVVDDDGLLDYVQVLHQFSFAALNSRRPRVLIWNYCFCNAIKRFKRPGESHEGVGRKKSGGLDLRSRRPVDRRPDDFRWLGDQRVAVGSWKPSCWVGTLMGTVLDLCSVLVDVVYFVTLRWLLVNDDLSILGVSTCENPTRKGRIWGPKLNIVRYGPSMVDLWLDLELGWSGVEVLFERGSMDLAGHLLIAWTVIYWCLNLTLFDCGLTLGHRIEKLFCFWVFIDVWGLT